MEEPVKWQVDVEALTLNDMVFLEELAQKTPVAWGDFRQRLASIVQVEETKIGEIGLAELWPLVKRLIKEINDALALPKASTTGS